MQKAFTVHKERPWRLGEIHDLRPVMIQVLEGENAVTKNRELMGATNPKEAAAGTILADFCRNQLMRTRFTALTASKNAAIEIKYFFGLISRSRMN